MYLFFSLSAPGLQTISLFPFARARLLPTLVMSDTMVFGYYVENLSLGSGRNIVPKLGKFYYQSTLMHWSRMEGEGRGSSYKYEYWLQYMLYQ